jgi:hypothetical protein
MSFVDDLRAEFEAPRAFVDVPVKLNKQLHTFRFFRMNPDEWLAACDMFPARIGIEMDMRFGYNLRGLTPVVAAQTGKRVEGDDLIDLTPDQWSNLFKALAGGVVGKIGDAIFHLNEIGPTEEIADLQATLKKVLAVVSGSNSVSPPASESPIVDSVDGSPES